MKEISPSTAKLLAFSMLKGVGPAALRRLAAAPDFESCSPDVLSRQLPSSAGQPEFDSRWDAALLAAELQISMARSLGARILSALDSEYPSLLSATKDDPFLLFVRGKLPSNPGKSVAIIGTRVPTKHGSIIADRISRHFAEREWSVVSGLASGCDTFAHRAALAVGGHTTAVVAHGLHTVSPKANMTLVEDILSHGGAIVSEYRIGIEPRPEFFVKRDRIQAGLAQGVVMVQSDLRGGSLHASRAALDYGRWLAVPYPTEPDLLADEPKVQANLLLAEGSERERMELLRCPSASLQRVIILKSRLDYQRLEIEQFSPSDSPPSPQGGLL